MKSLQLAAALAFAALATAPAVAAPRLVSLQAAGSGCPAATLAARLVRGKIALDLDALTAEAGDGADFARQRAACGLIVSISAPRQQVAIESVDVAFDAALPDDATASFSATAHIQGGAADFGFAGLDLDATTPQGTASLQTADLAWTPCGGGRAIVLQLAAIARAGGAFASASVTPTALHVKVRNCQ